MGLAIEHQGGRIDQFIGDAIVAFFPGEAAGAARRALAIALTMRVTHQALQRQRRHQGPFFCEIGGGVANSTISSASAPAVRCCSSEMSIAG